MRLMGPSNLIAFSGIVIATESKRLDIGWATMRQTAAIAVVFYPIDWPQLSGAIRFGRAKGRCEHCRRPHGRLVFHLGDGRWWDEEVATLAER